MKENHKSFWQVVWQQFRKKKIGLIALYVVFLFLIAGIYAPLLASSKPIFVIYNGKWYFPLFRYLFYSGFYTKLLDIFFNLLMLTLPVYLLALMIVKKFRFISTLAFIFIQGAIFCYLAFKPLEDPAHSSFLNLKKQKEIQIQIADNLDLFKTPYPFSSKSWEFELRHMTSYGKLNLLIHYRLRKMQQARFQQEIQTLSSSHPVEKLATLWQIQKNHENQQIQSLTTFLTTQKENYIRQRQRLRLLMDFCFFFSESHPENSKIPSFCHLYFPEKPQKIILKAREDILSYEEAKAKLRFIEEKKAWLEKESTQLHLMIMPIFSHFHWEDSAGGSQFLNQQLKWWEVTRNNRKDLVAALIFGIRISLVVGIFSVGIALLIGIPVGALAGYYAGNLDIAICRLLEIWEAMPTFFMLLLIVAMTQSKSIFLVIAVIGIFGWTGFCRFLRGEFFKQRHLPYVEACRSLGFRDTYIMFSHILPNAIPPLLTLTPFAIMAAISSEAGLSFLGLGDESSCSWGVLMDEGRSAFPAASYLLWPPAILLTILLVAIALVGDALRDALDPKLHIAHA